MNKEEYMRRLATALQGVAQAEKEEALQYYNDYFDDAGIENEQEVINALGTPEALAETVKKEQIEQQEAFGADTYSEESYAGTTENEEKKKTKLSGGWIALIVILTILASPLIIALLAAAFGAITGILAGVFSAIVALGAMLIALICVVIGCIIAAVAIGAISPFGALIIGGIGILTIGLSIFLLMALVWMFGVALPWIVKGIIKLFKKIFGKKGGNS